MLILIASEVLVAVAATVAAGSMIIWGQGG